jgi:PiT family inorganic phosphate transporter
MQLNLYRSFTMSVNSSVTSMSAPISIPSIDKPQHPFFKVVFLGVVVATLIYIGVALASDLAATPPMSLLPYLMLGFALLIALGFEFVNGFHDTANAVATVIYTNALPAPAAVVLSGVANFTGVMMASGAVAFGILALLPVELILNVGSNQGFAMVFALLIAAIVWNLGTWAFGIPASSSHTMIGSIIGVGLMNQILAPAGIASSSVDWGQALKVGKALLISPLLGFAVAGGIFLLSKLLFARKPELFEPPVGNEPPPFWIRGLLVLSCAGVSFFHGSNDGQKGMGLIMLILIGIVPMAYSLNKTMDATQVQTAHVLSPSEPTMDLKTSREVLTRYLQDHKVNEQVLPAIAVIETDVSQAVARYGTFDKVPADATRNMRNDMYLASAGMKRLGKDNALPTMTDAQKDVIKANGESLDNTTQFIPTWVKVAVALALGLGTMVGWKRIVVTVGEKIGNSPLNYGQGLAAQISTMAMIGVADKFGLPVSTTHVLNGSVAGTMTANRTGLQWSTVRSILSAWVLTLPAAITLSAMLYWIFVQFI